MNYNQAMKWQKKHPRGGAIQPMLFSTGSGFWPSGAWLKDIYWPYCEECKKRGETPQGAKEHYEKGIAR